MFYFYFLTKVPGFNPRSHRQYNFIKMNVESSKKKLRPQDKAPGLLGCSGVMVVGGVVCARLCMDSQEVVHLTLVGEWG